MSSMKVRRKEEEYMKNPKEEGLKYKILEESTKNIKLRWHKNLSLRIDRHLQPMNKIWEIIKDSLKNIKGELESMKIQWERWKDKLRD